MLDALDQADTGTWLLMVTHPCWPSTTLAACDLGQGAGIVQRERCADAAFLADATLAEELTGRDADALRRRALIRSDHATTLWFRANAPLESTGGHADPGH